jgi:hypothetical protein
MSLSSGTAALGSTIAAKSGARTAIDAARPGAVM